MQRAFFTAFWFAGLSLCASSLAVAQVAEDPYGPPPPPVAGTPEAAPGALAPPGAPARGEERFDMDCDPDIDVCVDPSADPAFDDGYDPNAYQQFESALSPYGQWSDDPNYGQVWTPSQSVVGADFEPYGSNGQWIASTDYGMAWASDYDWGWAPFHYGRWMIRHRVGVDPRIDLGTRVGRLALRQRLLRLGTPAAAGRRRPAAT